MKTRSEIEDQNWEVINETNEDFDKRLIENNMKRIKEFGASELMCEMFEGEVTFLTNTSVRNLNKENKFEIDDSEEIYRIYKLLQKADQEGGFDAFKEDALFYEVK